MSKTHYTMISETCSCGAKMEIETVSPEEGEKLLTQWRTKHQHLSYAPYRYIYPSPSPVTWQPPYGATWTVNNANLSSTPPDETPGLSVVS